METIWKYETVYYDWDNEAEEWKEFLREYNPSDIILLKSSYIAGEGGSYHILIRRTKQL